MLAARCVEHFKIERDDVERQLLEGTLSEQWKDDTLPLFAANLQQNINRALQMYMSTLHAERPAKLLMTGGAATITPLIDILQQDLALDIEAFNPFSTMKISDKLDAARLTRIAPQLAIAAGLASRSFTTWHM